MSRTARGLAGAPDAGDRRHGKWRYEVSLEVSWTCEHNVYVGLTGDLAEGGVFVATHQVLAPGSKLILLLGLPGVDPPEPVSGIVRWTRPPSDRLEAPPGMGVELVDPPPAVTAAIALYLAERDPVFYDD